MKQNSSIQMITDYEGDMPNLDVQVDGEIPIFVTRNLVMFPRDSLPYPRWQKTQLWLLSSTWKRTQTRL